MEGKGKERKVSWLYTCMEESGKKDKQAKNILQNNSHIANNDQERKKRKSKV